MKRTRQAHCFGNRAKFITLLVCLAMLFLGSGPGVLAGVHAAEPLAAEQTSSGSPSDSDPKNQRESSSSNPRSQRPSFAMFHAVAAKLVQRATLSVNPRLRETPIRRDARPFFLLNSVLRR